MRAYREADLVVHDHVDGPADAKVGDVGHLEGLVHDALPGDGGVSVELLASGACVILSTWLMAGAFALLCSAWCRTTVGATLASYLLGAALLLAPALLYSLSVRYILWGANLTGVTLPDFLWATWPPEVFE